MMFLRLPFIAAVLALVLALIGVGWRIHVKADAAGYAAVDRHAQRTALQLASLQGWVERMCVTPEK